MQKQVRVQLVAKLSFRLLGSNIYCCGDVSSFGASFGQVLGQVKTSEDNSNTGYFIKLNHYIGFPYINYPILHYILLGGP